MGEMADMLMYDDPFGDGLYTQEWEEWEPPPRFIHREYGANLSMPSVEELKKLCKESISTPKP